MRVHHIALRSRDLDRLVAFYESVFALPRVREQAGYSVWLGLDDAVLMIEQAGADEPAVPAGSREFLALAVDATQQDVVRQRLAGHGVTVEEQTAYTLYFRDPEGRRVGVSSYPLPELKG